MTYYHPHLVVAIVLELRESTALSLLLSPKAPRKRKAAGGAESESARVATSVAAGGGRQRRRRRRRCEEQRSPQVESDGGGGVLLCRRWTVVCPPRLAVASGPFHTAIVDLNIRARRRSRRLKARIGRRCRNAIMTEGAAAAESTDNILVDDERCDGRGQHWLCRLRGRLTT